MLSRAATLQLRRANAGTTRRVLAAARVSGGAGGVTPTATAAPSATVATFASASAAAAAPRAAFLTAATAGAAAAAATTVMCFASVAAAGGEKECCHSKKPAVATPPLKPRVVFVLGGPGAGKGTQCGRLVAEYGFVHLSAGDLLRDECKAGSPDGELISTCIKEGRIVPVEVTVGLLKKAMLKSPACNFLIDGFPRNYDNLEGWNRVMGNDVDVQFVLFYDTDEEVMINRIMERSRTSGRSDDNIETLRKRFVTFRDSSMPVVNEFAQRGMVRRIDSTASIEDVYKQTRTVMEPLVIQEVVDTNARLLSAISNGDIDTYKSLCDPSLTAFEPETSGLLVQGVEFHQPFIAANKCHPSNSTMTNTHVRFLGNTAVVSYNRIIQSSRSVAAVSETRVWKRTPTGWRNVHFHRSPVAAQH